jgi:hypothetical protein
MDNSYYKKKYYLDNAVVLNTESLLIDWTIEAITRIELVKKFETPITEFERISGEMEATYKAMNYKVINLTLWNIFKTKFLYYIQGLLYKNSECNYDNEGSDADFFLFFIDEWNAFVKKPYIHENISFDCLDCDTKEETAIIESYKAIIKGAGSESLYELTLAKNRALYMINNTSKLFFEEKPAKPKTDETTSNLPVSKKHVPKTNDNPDNPEINWVPDPNVTKIKEMLISNMEKITKGEMKAEDCNAFNSSVQTFINMSKQELEIQKFYQQITKK